MSRTILIIALLLAAPVNADASTVVAGGGSCSGVLATDVHAEPTSIAVNAGGTIYYGSQAMHRISRIVPSPVRVVEAVAGTGLPPQFGTAVSNRADQQAFTPAGIALGAGGTLYAASPAEGRVYRIMGPDLEIFALVAAPAGVAADDTHLWVVNGTNAFRYPLACAPGCQPDRTVSGLVNAMDVAMGPGGVPFVVENSSGGRVRRINADGSLTQVGGGWNNPRGLAVAPNGDIYVAILGEQRVVRIRDGVTTTAAGTGLPQNVNAWVEIAPGQPATQQPISGPRDVAVSGDGQWLYVVNDTLALNNDKRIRKFSLAGGGVPTASVAPTAIRTATHSPRPTDTAAPTVTRTRTPTWTPLPTATATIRPCAPGEAPSCQGPTL